MSNFLALIGVQEKFMFVRLVEVCLLSRALNHHLSGLDL